MTGILLNKKSLDKKNLDEKNLDEKKLDTENNKIEFKSRGIKI